MKRGYQHLIKPKMDINEIEGGDWRMDWGDFFFGAVMMAIAVGVVILVGNLIQ